MKSNSVLILTDMTNGDAANSSLNGIEVGS